MKAQWYTKAPPRRVLGFNCATGRGFVYSIDQSKLHRAEILFLDTPPHPNLQMVCSRIIDQMENKGSMVVGPTDVDTAFKSSVWCEGLEFKFAKRFIEKGSALHTYLQSVYFEKRSPATHGIVVMVPAMQGTSLEGLWGGGNSGPVGNRHASRVSAMELDEWIERQAMEDSCPF